MGLDDEDARLSSSMEETILESKVGVGRRKAKGGRVELEIVSLVSSSKRPL